MSQLRTAVLALGSNQGDRLAWLQAAVDRLASAAGVQVVRVSGVYETDPVGPAQPDYLNAVVLVETALPAEELLGLALDIEAQLGRVRAERWGPRTIDIDLVTLAEETWTSERLTLPHPRAHERAFVLVPWAEADPEAALPGHGPVRELLAEVAGATDGVRPRPDLALTVTR